ncbi:MAG: Fe(3+) ABC transporter substrate-binding protein [Pseudomonadota bacterium]
MKKLILLGAAALTLSACAEEVADNGELNLYSSRHYDTDLALYEDFTEQTGIKVNRIESGADALIERMESEGEFSPADLLITVDAGRLWRAEQAGVLSAVESDVLNERLPDYLRHPEGLWYGLSTRARVIIYSKEAGVPEGLDTYADLADPEWRGDICIRSSGNIYNISLLSGMIANDGAEVAEEWAKGVVANFAREPQGNDTAQIESTALGECRIALVNSYYLARFANGNEEQRAIFDALGVIFPDQGEGANGTHVNISGAGVAKHAPNRENAIAFLEYLTSESAQRYFADGNNEYPAAIGMTGNSALEEMGTFTPDTLNAAAIGENQREAVEVFDRAGWN